MKGRHIFTYGSLMFEEIWQCVIRNPYQREIAWLDGFRRTCVLGDTYPVILPRSGEKDLQGFLYLSVNPLDLRKLDDFEGDYYYRRKVFPRIRSGNAYRTIESETYVLKPRYAHLASLRPWDPQGFEERHLKHFIRTYCTL